MAYQRPPDVQEARALAYEKQDVELIQEAIDEWEAGELGMPARQALKELRERHRIA